MSSWLGGLLLQVGEWIIRKLPLVKHIYSAAKQARALPLCVPLSARGARLGALLWDASGGEPWRSMAGHRALAIICKLSSCACGGGFLRLVAVSLQRHSTAHSLGVAQWHCSV